ncbi:MAG: serine/threonine-protein phosphatase [Alistipes sp.]|nr:serine/threonine-protein phosphatase [Alistipes sp.]
MVINGGYATNIGIKRAVNQDSVIYRSFKKKDFNFVVMAVCDGVGGLQLGEVASALITEQISQWFDTVLSWIDFKNTSGDTLYAHLKDAAECWNNSVWGYCMKYNVKIGSTMSLLMIYGDKYYFLQVGDSRIYLYRKNELYQITVDACTSRIKNGKMKSYLDNYMGMREELWFTSGTGLIEINDLFIVCSDGFYHHLSLDDIMELCSLKKIRYDKECDRLVNCMIERGETDNISVGIVMCKRKK